jgi:hypothetical protein
MMPDQSGDSSLERRLKAMKDLLDHWRTETFGNGRIPRARMEFVTADLVRRKFLAQYKPSLLGEPHLGRTLPGDDWFSGLTALANYLAPRLAFRIGSSLPPGEKVDYETWFRDFVPNYRAIFGYGPYGTIEQDWAESEDFISKWSLAVRHKEATSHDVTLLVFATQWDKFPISLRYFNDAAACEYINAALDAVGMAEVNMDSYRKDIRGNREGLRLKSPTPDRTVISWLTHEPKTFYVSSSAAKNVGLDPDRFASAFSIGKRNFEVIIKS